MKRFFAFLRSMKFGVFLMILVIAFSLAGSLLPQGQPTAWYAQAYPQAARFLLALGFDDVFSSWYFLFIMGLLCINLTLCSILRFGHVHRRAQNALGAAREAAEEALQTGPVLSAEAKEKLCGHLSGRRYKLYKQEEPRIFYKNPLGFYGSFIVHLAILFILVTGALTLRLSQISDRNVMPGSSLTLADGTVLAVDSFRMTDATGRLDFVSVIRVTATDGAQSGPREIRVNYPFSFRSYKYYQHTYGTAGSIAVVNGQTGGKDIFSVTEPCFLSIDGRSGIWYQALYPGYIRDEDGHFTLITSTAGEYLDPVYQVLVASDGETTPVLAMPGETIQVGDISFTFNKPVAYPGIRIKYLPWPILAALYFSFVLLLAGFWLCFLHVPATVVVGENRYAILGSKADGLQLEIDVLLSEASQ